MFGALAIDVPGESSMNYDHYKTLKLSRPGPGILEIVMGAGRQAQRPTQDRAPRVAEIWRDVDADPETSVAIIRGLGKGFSGGGSLDLVETMTRDFEARARVRREARDLVYNLINCSKIVVSAMYGPAVGAGLVTGLLADISIAARNARDHRRAHAARRGRGRRCRHRMASAVRHGQGQVLPVAMR